MSSDQSIVHPASSAAATTKPKHMAKVTATRFHLGSLLTEDKRLSRSRSAGARTCLGQRHYVSKYRQMAPFTYANS
jgi:hypothetical protein